MASKTMVDLFLFTFSK